MKEALKKHYKDIVLVACYLLIAEIVYCVWMYSVFDSYKILFTILTGLVILAIGLVIGFLYLKPMIKAELNKSEEPKIEEAKEENNEDTKAEVTESTEEPVTNETDVKEESKEEVSEIKE